MKGRDSFTTTEGFRINVIKALNVAKRELESRNEKANFIRIMMRFPKIKSAFDRLRAIHVRCDKDGDGAVDFVELTEAMAELFNEGRAAGRAPIKQAVLERTFSSCTDLDGGDGTAASERGGIDSNQFIVMCAVGFILAEEDKDLSTFGGMLASGDDAYRGAMVDVVTAYLSFDREAKGYFTADEFGNFMTTSTRADEAKLFFTDERFAELDVIKDGKVTFEEFVYAFSKWVSDDDDNDDEDDIKFSRVKNPLTPRITLALQLSKSILDKKKKEVNFTRIIMRFPKIHQVFDRIISIHGKYDLNKDGRIQLSELTDAMKELMAATENEPQDSDLTLQVENIFMLSDLDHHGLQEGLDVKEFIVFCAVGFILAEAGGKSLRLLTGEASDINAEYRKAMMDIVAAYLTFDKEGKGYFTSDEMHAAKSDGGSKDAGNLLTPERWRELDIDHSGRIDFEEFVHAFSTWVTAGDDDDE
jgi:calcium-binding protein CML